MFTVTYAGYNVEEENYTRIFRPMGSGAYTFVFFVTPMHVYLDDSIEVAMPGSCVLYGPDDIQDYSAIRDFRMSFVQFDARPADLKKFGLQTMHVLTPECAEDLDELLKKLYSEFFTRDVFYEERTASLLEEILICIAREKTEKHLNDQAGRPLYNLFCQARYTILSNCDKEWASTNMCQMVSLSRSQFYKYYDDFFGVSPMADLASARIEKAKYLLADKHLQVTEVAKLCGYASIHHFSRTFKEHTGYSPLAYVKKTTLSD